MTSSYEGRRESRDTIYKHFSTKNIHQFTSQVICSECNHYHQTRCNNNNNNKAWNDVIVLSRDSLRGVRKFVLPVLILLETIMWLLPSYILIFSMNNLKATPFSNFVQYLVVSFRWFMTSSSDHVTLVCMSHMTKYYTKSL